MIQVGSRQFMANVYSTESFLWGLMEYLSQQHMFERTKKAPSVHIPGMYGMEFSLGGARASYGAAGAQGFAGNPLNRSVGDKKDEGLLKRALSLPQTKVVVLCKDSRGSGMVLCESSGDVLKLACLPTEHIIKMFGFTDIDDLLQNSVSVLLGLDPEDSSWRVAMSSPRFVQAGDEFVYIDGRGCLLRLSVEDKAIAGQALAFCSWHDANLYDGRTGGLTNQVECGLKRRVGDSGTKLYPRVDPVVICMVFSPSKEHVLLGKMRKNPKNFFSCISGFIEPCETVQEAAVREVLEETGVKINNVIIVDSQPWPIGRGGGCELMIGCVAVAERDCAAISISEEEVEEVRWFSIQEVSTMIEESICRSIIPASGMDHPFVPGPYAIAHHLLKVAISTLEQNDRVDTDGGDAAASNNGNAVRRKTAVAASGEDHDGGCSLKSMLRAYSNGTSGSVGGLIVGAILMYAVMHATRNQ